MDLIKEEMRLVDRKHKARDNVARKRKYFEGAQKSFRKARREFKVAAKILQAFRKEHKNELEELRTDPVEAPETLTAPGLVEEENSE